jgi:hypothetical protein
VSMDKIARIGALTTRIATYRELVRKGSIAPDPRMRRVAWMLAGSIGSFVVAGSLLPIRLRHRWPNWSFYTLFAVLILSYAITMYAAYVFSLVTDPKALRLRAREHHKRVT